MGVFMQFKKQGVGGAEVDSVHVMFSAEGSTQHANQSGSSGKLKCQCVPTLLTSAANNMGKYFGESYNFVHWIQLSMTSAAVSDHMYYVLYYNGIHDILLLLKS